jgi:RNA polymerase sigma factor (sigma-70 family)
MKPLSPDQQQLAKDHLGLACHIAHTSARRYPWLRDDMVCAASLAVCELAITWDTSRGMSFANYVAMRVRNAMVDMLRKQSPQRFRRYNASETAPPKFDHFADVGNMIVDHRETPIGEDLEIADELWNIEARLSSDARQIFRIMHIDRVGCTLQQAADEMSVCVTSASRYHHESLVRAEYFLSRRSIA